MKRGMYWHFFLLCIIWVNFHLLMELIHTAGNGGKVIPYSLGRGINSLSIANCFSFVQFGYIFQANCPSFKLDRAKDSIKMYLAVIAERLSARQLILQ